jgi:hypothetical protein
MRKLPTHDRKGRKIIYISEADFQIICAVMLFLLWLVIFLFTDVW